MLAIYALMFIYANKVLTLLLANVKLKRPEVSLKRPIFDTSDTLENC